MRSCVRGNGKLDGDIRRCVSRVVHNPREERLVDLFRFGSERRCGRWTLRTMYFLVFILARKCARLPQADLLRWRARLHSGVMVLSLSPSHRSRGYQGVGPTKNERYEKKAKVLPDPVPRSEMEH